MNFTISMCTPRKRVATRTTTSATLAVLILTLLAGCTRGPQADPRDAPQVALGKTVFASHGAACHGANLQGQRDWKSRKPDGKLPAPPNVSADRELSRWVNIQSVRTLQANARASTAQLTLLSGLLDEKGNLEAALKTTTSVVLAWKSDLN
jgi:hypothetical protein